MLPLAGLSGHVVVKQAESHETVISCYTDKHGAEEVDFLAGGHCFLLVDCLVIGLLISSASV